MVSIATQYVENSGLREGHKARGTDDRAFGQWAMIMIMIVIVIGTRAEIATLFVFQIFLTRIRVGNR